MDVQIVSILSESKKMKKSVIVCLGCENGRINTHIAISTLNVIVLHHYMHGSTFKTLSLFFKSFPQGTQFFFILNDLKHLLLISILCYRAQFYFLYFRVMSLTSTLFFFPTRKSPRLPSVIA